MTEQLSLDALWPPADAVGRRRPRRRPAGRAEPASRAIVTRSGRGGAAPSEAPSGGGTLPLVPAGLDAASIARLLGRPAPTPEQQAVIEAPMAPLLVVAGAGSGKTETMAARVVWLVANGMVHPEQVLGLTFTRKAAAELAGRVRARLRALGRAGVVADGGPPTVSTYHSYAAAVVSDHGLRIGVEPQSSLLGEAAAWQLVDELVERWDGPMSDVDVARRTAVEHVLALAGQCAEHLVTPAAIDSYLEHLGEQAAGLPRRAGDARAAAPGRAVREVLARAAARRQLLALVEAFSRRKRERGVLDFGDQVALAARVAREVPAVGAAERARFPVVLLDEYQDTSHAQYVLLRSVFGSGHPVTAVGDPNQSIYGWRGASAGTLQRFVDQFPHADGSPARSLHLSTSWRNDRAVLDVANAVAADLRRPVPWTPSIGAQPGVRPLVARPDAGPGRVEVFWQTTLEEELTALADVAEQAWRAGTAGGGEAGDRAPTVGAAATVAVLCRTRAQFPLIEAALRCRGLPVEVVGLGGLLHVPEVADLRAALEVVHDPSRGDSLMRLLTGAAWRIGPRDLQALGVWATQVLRSRGAQAPPAPGRRSAQAGAAGQAGSDISEERSIVEALDVLPGPDWSGPAGESLSAVGRVRLDRLAGVLRDLRTRASISLPDLVQETERALLLDVEVASVPGRSPAAARANLDAFLQVAASFDGGGSSGRAALGAFLGWLSAAELAERGLEAAVVEHHEAAIQLLTIHAGKGLEWDVVLVPGMVEGTFPAGTNGRPPGPSGGWTTDLGTVPFPVRGDADMVPQWDVAAATSQDGLAASLVRFKEQCGEYEVAEERRLAYVAFTRARERLVLTGAVWGDGKMPRSPSRFLQEVAACPGVVVHSWAEQPAPTAAGEDANPRHVQDVKVAWPVDPLGPRRAAVEDGARLVLDAVERLSRGCDSAPSGRAGTTSAVDTSAGTTSSAEASAWALEADLLLAEREAGRGGTTSVRLPGHLSVSRMVQLAQDPVALAMSLRRPMPQAPQQNARRGSAFHAWLERRYAASTLVDIDELPGAADDAHTDSELSELCERFLASEWAELTPEAVEVSVETPVGDLMVRGRIDAVFRRAAPGAGVASEVVTWDVVDWKTSPPPRGAAQAAARAVQLAVYRLAWARLHGVDVSRVGAAFFYASTGETVRPVDLLDAGALSDLVRQAVTSGGGGSDQEDGLLLEDDPAAG